MFIVLLKFTSNKSLAPTYMAAHKQWIENGFSNGVFLLAASLENQMGGSVLVHNVSRHQLDALVASDPFVEHGVVTAEVIELKPNRADERLEFLLPKN